MKYIMKLKFKQYGQQFIQYQQNEQLLFT